MQVSVETTSELNRKMTVEVPEEAIQEKIKRRLQSLAHEVKIDGFRPGKAPHSLIQKRYGQQVREEIVSDLIESSFYEAVRNEKLKPAGVPKITAQRIGEGEGLAYQADFEVLPEFVPMPLETLNVTRYTSEVNETDVDEMVNKLREQQKTWSVVDRPAVNGDRVTISFDGKVDGESFTDGRVESFQVMLGSGGMIPGFEENLQGATAGSQLKFDSVFPEDYSIEKLAGKTGSFEVDVESVEASELPEVDAEFVKRFGIEEGGIDAFRADIRANMEREMRRSLKARTKTSVMDALFARNSIVVPEVLVQDEIRDLIKPYEDRAKAMRQSINEAKLREQMEPNARRRVALALILGRVIEAHGVKLDGKKVRSAVDDLAASYEQPEEVVRWYYAEKDRLQEVENMVMEDQVVDLILEKAQVKDETIAFQALMQPGAQAQA